MRATNPPVVRSIGRFTITLANAVGDQPSAAWKDKLELLIKYRNSSALHKKDRALLVRALRGLANRWGDYADRLEASSERSDESQQGVSARAPPVGRARPDKEIVS